MVEAVRAADNPTDTVVPDATPTDFVAAAAAAVASASSDLANVGARTSSDFGLGRGARLADAVSTEGGDADAAIEDDPASAATATAATATATAATATATATAAVVRADMVWSRSR